MPKAAKKTRSSTAAGAGGAAARRRPWLAARLAVQQAENHRRTRKAHSAEIAEDYVETIADLIDGGGEARVVDLARCLGVTHVTVVRTVVRLQRDELVTARPYRSIFLTDSGRKLAEKVRERHRIVYEFLRAVGVGEASARLDSEGIEHHVSAETLAAFARFVAKK